MGDEGLNHSLHSKQNKRHFMSAPKLPRSQGGDAKGPRWIFCTLGLLGSLGPWAWEIYVFYGKPALCFLGRLDLIPQDCSRQTGIWVIPVLSSQGFALFAGTLAQGPWWVVSPKSRPGTFMCHIINATCHLLDIMLASTVYMRYVG